MNKRLLDRCNKILESNNNSILLSELVDILNANSDFKKCAASLPNAIKYIESKGTSVIKDNMNLFQEFKKNAKELSKRTKKYKQKYEQKKKRERLLKNKENINKIEKQLDFDNVNENYDVIIEDLIERNLEQTDEFVVTKKSKYGNDSYKWYLNTIAHIGYGRLLTAEEEIDLCNRAQKGDKEAERIMTENNLKLVASIARRYFNVIAGIDEMDIIQAGNLGLLKAISKFDTEKGNRFSTYATWWIRQAITRHLSDEGRFIRLPVHMVEQCRYMKQAVAELNDKLSRTPTNQEVADYMNKNRREKVTAADVKDYLQWYDLSTPISIYTPIGDEEDSVLCDFIPSETSCEDIENNAVLQEMRTKLDKVFKLVLTPKETEVIKRRFGFNETRKQETLETIAATMNVTRERIRQIESKAIKKLRNSKRAKDLLFGLA